MRWGSHGYKIGINEMEHRLSSGAFSISIMNLEAHRPATDESNETLAACGAHGRRSGVAPRSMSERSGRRSVITRNKSRRAFAANGTARERLNFVSGIYK